MRTVASPSLKTVGFWSAVLATAFSISYSVLQIGEWIGLLGSAGGPESSSTPLGIALLLTPSLLLGPSFLVMMVSVNQLARSADRVWTHSAVAFATTYTVMIAINYYVQLAWVAPRLVRGEIAGMEPFLFVPFDSFLYAVDILGYSFMSASTLIAAPAFRARGLERVIRWFLIANGLVMPFLLFQMYVHWLIWIAAAWAITFPGATWSIAVLFSRLSVESGREEGLSA